MTKEPAAVNNAVNTTIAPLRNVALFTALVERVLARPIGLPGMAVFHGHSGLGKTYSATYAANKYRAHHVQAMSCWNRKALCEAVLHQMGLRPEGTIPKMVARIGEELTLSNRPLVIDEADHLVAPTLIELVRDIYESSQAAVILIGGDQLPNKLRPFEQVHGRMMDWVQAQLATLGDAQRLAPIYCPGIAVADDLLAAIHKASGGSVRRVAVNLAQVREGAAKDGRTTMKLEDFKGDFFTGNPAPRGK